MKSYFFLLFFLFTSLVAEEASPRLEKRTSRQMNAMQSITNAEGGASSIVHQCVNVITGDFSDVQVDLIIPGPEPIILERSYSTINTEGNSKKNLFDFGWTINQGGSIFYDEFEKSELLVREGTGTEIPYKMANDSCKYRIELECLHRGFTNCGSGAIDSRSNIKNNQILRTDEGFELKLGSGGLRKYKPFHGGDEIYHLKTERKPSGNFFTFKYNHYHCLGLIRALNRNAEILAEMVLEYGKNLDGEIVVRSSDNRKVKYSFQKLPKKLHGRQGLFLQEVIRPGNDWEKYHYDGAGFLTRKERPDGRCMEIDYYEEGRNAVGIANVKLYEGDERIKRVKLLREPVGTDANPIITYRFFYHLQEKENITAVYNAHDIKTDYGSKDDRLTRITRCDRTGKIYSEERFFWGNASSSHQVGNLVSRTLQDHTGRYLYCRYFKYDMKGNVIQEELHGNLTGNPQHSVVVENGIPKRLGADVYQQNYVYTHDDFNLLILETNGRRKILYVYVPDTDLVSNKFFLTPDDHIYERYMFVYDKNGAVVTEIHDDGITMEMSNLTGVTERHIKSIINHNHKPRGLPEVVIEKAVDFAAGGVERTLKTTINRYSPQGNLIKQEIYDSNGTLASTLHWEYDERGNILKEVNPLGETTLYAYDANGNKTYEKRPNSNYHTEYTYDFANRLIRQEDVYENGIRLGVSHRYDLLGQRIATIDIYGNVTQFFFDDFGNQIETHYAAVYNEAENLCFPKVQTHYDIQGYPICKRNERGLLTNYKHNILGQLTDIQYPDGSTEGMRYTFDGLLEKVIYKNGSYITHQHDTQGRVTLKETYSPQGELISRVSSTYNTFHLLEETDPAGHITYYKYDYAGRLKETTKGDKKIAYQYDFLSRIAKKLEYFTETDYTAYAFEYDALDRLVEERIEDSQANVLKKVQYVYDENGNKTQIKHYCQAGVSITTAIYNGDQEPNLVIDAEGNETKTIIHYFNRNELNQGVAAKEIIDPQGNTTLMTCDVLGRLVKIEKKDRFGQVTSKQQLVYDASGNRVLLRETAITPNGAEREVKTFWQYDFCNRMVTCFEAVGLPEQKCTRWSYNLFGQLEHLLKPDCQDIKYQYDIQGRLLSTSASDFSYLYSYDMNHNVTEVKNLLTNKSTCRSYDANDRLMVETLDNGLQLQYGYDRQGRATKMTLSDGTTIDYVYNAGFLKEIKRGHFQHTYRDFDLSGNLLSETLIGQAGDASYEYDILNRLRKKTTTHWKETGLSYDKVGNLLQHTIADSQGTVNCSYQYDALYQLIAEDGNASHRYRCDSLFNCVEKDGIAQQINPLNQLLDDGKSKYHYDPNGNLTQKISEGQEVTYQYDSLDRLVKVIKGKEVAEYHYDEMNRRTSKTLYVDSKCQSVIRYLYQGSMEIGAVNEKNQIIELRVLGMGKGAEIGAAVAIELQHQVYVPVHDHNGNVSSLVKAEDGTVVETYRYTAFGEQLGKHTTLNPWGFSSKRLDKETGFLCFGRRYYNPETHRWLTPDPIGFEDGPNLYAYVHNNPMTHYDLYGLLDNSEAQVVASQPTQQARPSFLTRIRHFLERVRDAVKNVCHFPGRVIEYIANNFVPLPFVRDGVEIIGRLLSGKCFKNYAPSFKRNHSLNAYVGTHELANNTHIVLDNGIGVWTDEMIQRMEKTSQDLGGVRLYFTYNSTKGIIYDAIEWVCQRVGIPTRSSRLFAGMCTYLFEKDGLKCLVYPIGHSQGGEMINDSARTLPQWMRDRMFVTTLGSAHIIDPKKFGKVRNIVCGSDCVPWLTNPIEMAKAKLGISKRNVAFIPGKGCPVLDHYYEGAYDVAAKESIKEIIKNHGYKE